MILSQQIKLVKNQLIDIEILKNPIYQLANIVQSEELINSLNAKAKTFTSKGKNR